MQVLHRRYLTLFAVAFTIAIPHIHFELPIQIELSNELFGIAFKWLWTLTLALIVFRIERRPREFLQLRGFRLGGLVEAVINLSAALLLMVPLLRMVENTTPDNGDAEPAALWIRLAGAITAGVCEEFMFRGFLIEEVGEWMRSRKMAAVIAAVAFAAGHWNQGWIAAFIGPGIIGAALTIVYFRQKSLPLCMILHSGLDVCYELLH